MRKRFYLLFVLYWGCFAPLSTFSQPPEVFHLNNGLRVIVMCDERAPVVAMSLFYHVGSINDPLHKSGIAHFLEHMMFQGLFQDTREDFKTIVTNLGGTTGATTTFDYTNYYTIIPKKNITKLLALEADRMAQLSIADERFQKERHVVIQERLDRIEDAPSARANEIANAHFYMQNRYGRSVIGWLHEIETILPHDITSFHTRWYAPNNATIVLSGDVSVAEAKTLMAQYFSKIPQRTVPPRPQEQNPLPDFGRQTLEFVHPEFGFSTSIFYKLPASVAQTWNQYKTRLTLQLLTSMLKQKLNKVFINHFKSLHEITVQSYTAYKEATEFSVSFSIKNLKDGQAMTSVIENTLQQLTLEQNLTEDDLKQARFTLKNSFYETFSNLLDRAKEYGAFLTTGISIEDLNQWESILESITLADIQGMLKDITSPGPRLIAYLLSGEASQ